MRKSRFPELKFDANGKVACRGCGGAITEKRRRTWCSQSCIDKHEPGNVIQAVEKRDKGVCRLCRLDIKAAAAAYEKTRPVYGDYPENPSLDWPERGQERYRRYAAALRQWDKDRIREEYDHVIPFSEGGATVVENMRTLCRPCHVKVTAEWRAAKALLRKANRK